MQVRAGEPYTYVCIIQTREQQREYCSKSKDLFFFFKKKKKKAYPSGFRHTYSHFYWLRTHRKEADFGFWLTSTFHLCYKVANFQIFELFWLVLAFFLNIFGHSWNDQKCKKYFFFFFRWKRTHPTFRIHHYLKKWFLQDKEIFHEDKLHTACPKGVLYVCKARYAHTLILGE